MKFGSQLTEDLVPEWRGQYFNYKEAKKLLKKVKAAIRKRDSDAPFNVVQRSPFSSLRDGPVSNYLQRKGVPRGTGFSPRGDTNNLKLTRSRSETQARPVRVPVNERSPLRTRPDQDSDQPAKALQRYGSIIGSPPKEEDPGLYNAPSLELPGAAISSRSNPLTDPDYDRPVSPDETGKPVEQPQPPATQLGHRGNAYEITRPVDTNDNRPFTRRFTSFAGANIDRFSRTDRDNDVALEAYNEIDFRQGIFFDFLNKELAKIETFHKEREREAEARLAVLKDQLHFLRDQRIAEMRVQEAKQKMHAQRHQDANSASLAVPGDDQNDDRHLPSRAQRLSQPFKASVDVARGTLAKAKPGHVGRTSQAMEHLASPSLLGNIYGGREYNRRDTRLVSYSTAKRKLKNAFVELYRGLEFIQGYADLNKIAFRKITKKFDKNATSTMGKSYMKDQVDTADFVQSHLIGEFEQQVEDLYARYFERGDRKAAVKKLRRRVHKEGAFYGPTMRTGLVLGIAIVFAIQGLVYGAERLLHAPDPVLHTQTSYLLQLYGGYFVIWLLFALFCIDAAVFTSFRVNYQFIFEFDQRNMLNWKQLCEPAAWFFLCLGLCMWLNFSDWCPPEMYIYWPVVLIGVSAVLLFSPIPFVFYAKSRMWFNVSIFRLLLPGLFSVEFRDFFLGDMLCSLTYALGNIELFFCLYAHHWKDPPQCNSSHSMLLGFFSAVPGIIRLLQTFRRYYENRLFTHGLNAGKYTCTILQYMSLSLWRIYGGEGWLAFFIISAVINGLYTSIWDLFYDWSMPALDPYAKPYPFLRANLAFKKHLWLYYTAMVIDPILRFNWIFYVIFRHDSQHSTLVSLFVALSEVFRRGLWVLFRVENEHCTNVSRSKALRDPSLPYQIKRLEDPQSTTDPSDDGSTLRTSATDEETGATPGLRRRRTGDQSPTSDSPMYATLKRVGSTFRNAHAMDYERKKPPSERESKKEEEEEDEEDEDDSDSE